VPPKKKAKIIPTKGIYGKPWSKISSIPVSRDVLERVGQILVDSVVEEAKKDFAKQRGMRTPRGEPMGLPVSKRFYESFGYKIVGKSTVTITTTWEWFPRYEGRRPYRMPWLTRERGVNIVPFPQDDGTVIFRTAPLTTAKAWIHPGVARHTFLQRGLRKGRQKAAQILSEELIKVLSGSPIT
jgi:hypothetical protein